MGKIADFLRGRDLIEPNGSESRTLARGDTQEGLWYSPPTSQTSLPAITQVQALRIADVYAACRVLADGVASLPPRVYRRTSRGRVGAGEDQRLVQLLRRPSPGSTSADLFSDLMVSLLTDGNAFVGKFRREETIVQLGVLDPQTVAVERKGDRVIYKLSRREGLSEHGPEDVLHVRAMGSPQDGGLRGLSPVRQAMRVLQLNQGLIDYLANWLGNDSRPGGVLAINGDAPAPPGRDEMHDLKEQAEADYGWERKPPGHGRIAVMTGELSYAAIDPPLREQEFIAQRELSAREVARVMRVPAWSIDAGTPDSMTYANVQMQARALVDFSLRPWITRIEQAISGDPDLCPGSTYLALDTDQILRADLDARSAYYERALNPETGWLTRAEVREELDLPPEEGN
jgi:HK97 family phage portal protein